MPKVPVHLVTIPLFLLMAGCDLEPTSADLVPAGDLPTRATAPEVRLLAKFTSRGGGPVFVKLTAEPTQEAVAALSAAGLQGLPRPDSVAILRFDNLKIRSVAGYLEHGALDDLAALPFVERIESAEDADSISPTGAANVARRLSRIVTPQSAYSWNIDMVKSPSAWRLYSASGQSGTNGSHAALTAILDDGLDYTLYSILFNSGGVDPWEWYYRPMNHGDFATGDHTTVRWGDHGTAVGGFMAGDTLSEWVPGTAPYQFLAVHKVLPADDWTPVVAALDDVILDDVSVVNMSFGNCGELPPSTVHDAIKAVHNASTYTGASGVALVGAGGNGLYNCDNQLVVYPAAYHEVIAVGAIGESYQFDPSFSFGPEIDLVAPGLSLTYVKVGGGTGCCRSGTSFAAPHVAGAVATLRDVQQDWSATYVESRLRQTASKLSGQGLPRDDWAGYGLLDHFALLAWPDVSVSGPTTITSSGDYTWDATVLGGRNVAYQWRIIYADGQQEILGTEPSQTIHVTAWMGDFDVKVSTSSDGYGDTSVQAVANEIECGPFEPC